jgi:twinkle protein
MSDKFTHMNKFASMGFKVRGNNSQQKSVCHGGSECKNPDARNKRDTCVSLNMDDGIWNCHKCSASGSVAERSDSYSNHAPIRKSWDKPKTGSLKKLIPKTDPIIEWFKSRGIPESVVLANNVVSERDWIVIPYIRDGKLVNLKKRHIREKDWRQSANAEPIMFNRDRCVDPDWIIVVEGEFDAMAIETAGFTNVTSPNQGAPNPNDKNVDKKLECIDNTWEIFETKKRIVIAVDNDDNGRRLQRELIRRFGAERCQTVDWGDVKDANECLITHGIDRVVDMIKNAVDVPISGIWTIDDAWDSMLDGFRNGKKRGVTTYMKGIDPFWTWRTGDVNLWTGYNNEGKTTLLNQMLLLRAKFDGEKCGVFSPENYPADEFFDDLIHTLVGKPTDPHFHTQMTESEYSAAAQFVNDHFFIVHPDELFDLKTLFEKFQFLVRRHGVRHIVFDPWNQIDHDMKSGEREDLYISRTMTKFKRFAIDNDVSVNIVAHQNTPRELDGAGNYHRPNKYNLKGGGTFSDKTDNVLGVWRPFMRTDKRDPTVTFISEKIKKQRLVGMLGEHDLMFNYMKNRYTCDGVDPFDKSSVRELPQQMTMITSDMNFVDDDHAANPEFDDLPF